MSRYIKTAIGRYLIRGNWTVVDLKNQFRSFQTKYGTSMSFDQWLVERGKVYVRVK
jgi:hypothetical protein